MWPGGGTSSLAAQLLIHWTLDGAKVSVVGKTQDGGHGTLQGRMSLPRYAGKGLEERELDYVTRRYEKRHAGGHLGMVMV